MKLTALDHSLRDTHLVTLREPEARRTESSLVRSVRASESDSDSDTFTAPHTQSLRRRLSAYKREW